MRLDSLYSIENIQISNTEAEAQITFEAGHEIFKGHFPGQPIVPGVCLLQIIKEVAAAVAGGEVLLTKGSNIKFLNLIDPQIRSHVSLKLTYTKSDDDGLKLNATIFLANTIFVKFKGVFSNNHSSFQ